MSQLPVPGAARPRRVLRTRIAWFVAGSVVNYLMISTPFKWLKGHTGLSLPMISACSVGFSTVFFFIWNYSLNFRTEVRKRDALPRYILAVVCMWALSSTLLAFLKNHDFHRSLSLFGSPLDLDIITTQAVLGGLKFLLYHFWVFPPARHAPPAQEIRAA